MISIMEAEGEGIGELEVTNLGVVIMSRRSPHEPSIATATTAATDQDCSRSCRNNCPS